MLPGMMFVLILRAGNIDSRMWIHLGLMRAFDRHGQWPTGPQDLPWLLLLGVTERPVAQRGVKLCAEGVVGCFVYAISLHQ